MDEIIWSTNIRGIISKLPLIQHEIQHHQPSLVVICETFLTANVPDTALNIPDYSFFRRDRGSFAGGVIVYFKNSLRIQRLTHFEKPEHEAIWYNLQTENNLEIFGCAAYWPPSPGSNLMQHIQETSDAINFNRNSVLLIAGDLNAHHSSLPLCTHTNASGAALYSLMCNNDLQQVVTEYTRVTADSKACLDIMLTIMYQSCFNSKVFSLALATLTTPSL